MHFRFLHQRAEKYPWSIKLIQQHREERMLTPNLLQNREGFSFYCVYLFVCFFHVFRSDLQPSPPLLPTMAPSSHHPVEVPAWVAGRMSGSLVQYVRPFRRRDGIMLPMTILILTRVQGKYPQNVATYQVFLSKDSEVVMGILRSERLLQGLCLPTPHAFAFEGLLFNLS